MSTRTHTFFRLLTMTVVLGLMFSSIRNWTAAAEEKLGSVRLTSVAASTASEWLAIQSTPAPLTSFRPGTRTDPIIGLPECTFQPQPVRSQIWTSAQPQAVSERHHAPRLVGVVELRI